VDKEVGYIDSPIALEKLRIRNPELLQIHKDIQYPHLKISPMLLVPFVENAFKHGDFRGKGFEMKISDDHKILHFYLLNFKKKNKRYSFRNRKCKEKIGNFICWSLSAEHTGSRNRICSRFNN
jgi:hypothetical protein